MGFVRKTPAGTFRAFWRDPAGKQRSKNFAKQREAKQFLSSVESTKSSGSYIDPTAGKVSFAVVASEWLNGYDMESSTVDRAVTALRSQILPVWGSVSIGRIDHLGVASWVKELRKAYSPATVRRALQVMNMVLTAAVRSRLITVNPCSGVLIPKTGRQANKARAIDRDTFEGLLSNAPRNRRVLLALSGYAGLRWGEAAGIPWDAVDLAAGTLEVVQVATEVNGTLGIRGYPKSTAGRRIVPIPRPLFRVLSAWKEEGDEGLVCAAEGGGPIRRVNFRRDTWRPCLVRAGLLGDVSRVHTGAWESCWKARSGQVESELFASEAAAVRAVADRDVETGLRFHDLRHSYITWLIEAGMPVNAVQRLAGHAKPSTTLDRYTHLVADPGDGIADIFGD